MYLEEVRREDPGRFADRGAEGIKAIDANTSAYKIYLIKEKVIRITNQVKFYNMEGGCVSDMSGK